MDCSMFLYRYPKARPDQSVCKNFSHVALSTICVLGFFPIWFKNRTAHHKISILGESSLDT